MSDGASASAVRLVRSRPWALKALVDACLALALAGYAAATFATLFLAEQRWTAELVTHFRPQLLAGAAALALVLALAGRARWIVPLAAAAAIHAAVMLRPVPVPAASGSGPTLRLVQFNVYHNNPEHARVLGHVRAERADVLVAEEADGVWAGVLDRLRDRLPFTTRRKGADTDIVVMSRFPIVASTLQTPRDEAGRYLGPPFVRAELDVEGRRVVLWAVHPPSPITRWHMRSRNASLQWLAARVADEDPSLPVIVAGDFNQTPWTPWHRAFLERSGLIDAAGTSWPAATRRPFPPLDWWALGVPIDRVTVRRGIGVARHEIGPDLGSDHLPLTVDLVLGEVPPS